MLASGLLVSAPLWADFQGRFYRYHDANGKVVVSSSIPKEFAANGYDILNGDLKLIQTVAPHSILTDEEKLAKQRLREQQVEDHYLLKSYSSVGEIQAAMDRKLSSLARDIAAIEDNLQQTRLQRQQEERKAANAQRGGRVVSNAILKLLNDLERRENDATLALQQRREESEKERQRYQAYISRYVQLTQPQQ